MGPRVSLSVPSGSCPALAVPPCRRPPGFYSTKSLKTESPWANPTRQEAPAMPSCQPATGAALGFPLVLEHGLSSPLMTARRATAEKREGGNSSPSMAPGGVLLRALGTSPCRCGPLRRWGRGSGLALAGCCLGVGCPAVLRWSVLCEQRTLCLHHDCAQRIMQPILDGSLFFVLLER